MKNTGSESNDINYFEHVFRNSISPEQLFDALSLAIKKGICDGDLYKILLANPALSPDEIIMFTEKLSKEFNDCSYDLFLWTGYLFQMRDHDLSLIDNSLYYYQKAFMIDPENHQPLLSALSLYNYEIALPVNDDVLRLVNTGLIKAKQKSPVYKALSKHYRKTGREELARKFAILSENAARKEDQ